MTEPLTLTDDLLAAWADDPAGPVALHLRQRLLPVEGEGGVIFPPTYADIGYNVDTLSDGTKVATIDSVGSQANRMEPIFKREPYAALVPQIEIELESGEIRSLLDLAHRGADAVVYASPKLNELAHRAFAALRKGDAEPLCALAPTSLVFGFWDSRGESAEKRPRLLRSVVRAHDVDVLHAASQFNSISKALTENERDELEKEAKARKVKLSEKGFADAPGVFRKLSQAAARQMPQFRDGVPNPDVRTLGGVIAKGPIVRDITINLVALRLLGGASPERTTLIREYLLSLALLGATADIDPYFREGCLLRFAEDDAWRMVPRRGTPQPIDLGSPAAHAVLKEFASARAEQLKVRWPSTRRFKFDLNEAKKLLAKKSKDEDTGEE